MISGPLSSGSLSRTERARLPAGPLGPDQTLPTRSRSGSAGEGGEDRRAEWFLPEWLAGRACGRGFYQALLALLAVSVCAMGQDVGDEEFKERDIERGDDPYTLVTYRGLTYRRVELSDLRGLSVGNTQLNNLRVCVEGKFDRPVSKNVFRLMGSGRQFAVADMSITNGLMTGDNVWIGGLAKPVRGEPSCYVAVGAIIRLKDDEGLFNERCAKFARAKDWRKLLDLGRRIEASGKLVKSAIVADVDLYDSLRDRAIRQALRVREQGLADDDVVTRVEVAKMYKGSFGRTGDLRAAEILRRVMELDPGHEEAARMLTALGYVAYKGRWMTRLERTEIERRERAALDAARVEVSATGETPTVGATGARPEALATTGRMRRMIEIERKARSGSAALLGLASVLAKEDDAVARRLVWILANTGGAEGLEGLLKGLQSQSAAVRRDVADALAWCGCVRDLADMVRGETKVDVRSHAVSALGSVRTRASIDTLVELLSVKDMATRTRVGEELARATGQTISDPAAWRRWWEINRDGFEEPSATP